MGRTEQRNSRNKPPVQGFQKQVGTTQNHVKANYMAQVAGALLRLVLEDATMSLLQQSLACSCSRACGSKVIAA